MFTPLPCLSKTGTHPYSPPTSTTAYLQVGYCIKRIANTSRCVGIQVQWGMAPTSRFRHRQSFTKLESDIDCHVTNSTPSVTYC